MDNKKIKRLLKRVSWYPPYLGAGIKLKSINEDFTRFEVELRMTWYNRNLFGTHFGGSLYAMCDPFYVFIVLNYLGNDYVVWDKSAKIKFIKPGKGTVKAIFEISQDELIRVKNETDIEEKKTFFFTAIIKNNKDEKVATVEKEIYVRKKIKKTA